MRTLRQIPRVVGQTDAGETIYEARSARLVLRGDAAHFNRLVRCSKCGREVPGRAVLSLADLDQPPQAVVCNDCVEAATDSASRPGRLAEPAEVNDPAVADAQAEMNLGLEELVEEPGEPDDGDEADEPGVAEIEEAEGDELEEAPPAAEEPTAVNLQLIDDVAALDEDDLPAPDEDELLMAEAVLDDVDSPAPAPDDDLLETVEPPAPVPDDELFETEPSAPAPEEDDEPVVAAAGLIEDEPEPLAPEDDAPAQQAAGPHDDGLARRIQDLEDRLANTDLLDPLRLVALEETVHRLAERADAQGSIHVDIEERLEQLAGASALAQGKKEGDKLRRRVDQMGERLVQLQATIDAEWARAKSETATLGQTLAELGQRVLRLAEQAGAAAGDEDERLAAMEERLQAVTTDLAEALHAQRKELQDGLRKGLAEVLSAIPPAPAPAEDVDGRLRAMEKQVRQGRAEVTELNELHAALDAGLGALRGELGELRTGFTRMADSKADLDDRLETFVRMSLVPEGEKGRKAKKAAESTLGTLSAAVQDLMREQRQLKDTVAGLERVSDAATASASRASMQATSLMPLRSDVKLLHQEIVEQQEALDELRRTVDGLRQPAKAAPAPPAPKTPPAKNAQATKAVAAAKTPPVKTAAKTAKATPARGGTARAALAKAAAAQAAAGKAPAAERARRAKKA